MMWSLAKSKSAVIDHMVECPKCQHGSRCEKCSSLRKTVFWQAPSASIGSLAPTRDMRPPALTPALTCDLTSGSPPAHVVRSCSCIASWQLLLQFTTLTVELIDLTLKPGCDSQPLSETTSRAKSRKIEALTAEREEVERASGQEEPRAE